MNSMRAVLIALSLLLSCSVHSQTTWPWTRWVYSAGPTSVAIGADAVVPFTTQIAHVDGGPAAGIPFRYWTEPECGSFTEGDEVTGFTDEEGLAVSSTFSGVGQDLGCRVYIEADGMDPIFRTVDVFDPSWVVVAAVRPKIDALANTAFGVPIDLSANGQPVNASLPEVTVGTSSSGATAVPTGGSCEVNNGRCVMTFQANGRAGQYPIRFRINESTASVQVKQRRP